MAEPKRIQRKRAKGWRMPENAVYVGRPTIFGNITSCSWPYGCPHSPKFERWAWEDDDGNINPYRCCVDAYRHLIETGFTGEPTRSGGKLAFAFEAMAGYPTRAEIIRRLPELRGKDLACWCPLTEPDGTPRPCHADVLLEFANPPHSQGEGNG